tara:strand:- start:7163 stop:10006 length:2844 start_codon:yes stop_codon:yes gene_type:complete
VVKDCAESVTVANPVMNAIAGIQVGDLKQETTLNEQINTRTTCRIGDYVTRIEEEQETPDVKLRSYYINYKKLCGDFFDLGANLKFFDEEPLLIEKEMKSPDAAKLLSDLVDEERRRFLEQELKEIEEEEINQMKQKLLAKTSIDWLLRYYLVYTMNEFYLKMAPFSVDENSEYNTILLSLCVFRKKVTEFFANFKNQTLIRIIGDRSNQSEEQLRIISIAEGLVLHSENQYLKVSNQYLEIMGSGPELVKVKTRLTKADTSGTDIMRWIWQREVLLVPREFSQKGVFKELPFEEHDIELQLNQQFFKTEKTPTHNIVMSKMANDFFSVGMHNVMEEVITSFKEWNSRDFELSWMKTWGYDFREGKSIEKESVEKLEEMRKKVLSYDPLLLIVAEQELKKSTKVRDERLVEFVEVQLLLTKICHLPVHARRWKHILTELGIKKLGHMEFFIRFKSTEQELIKSFIRPPYGKKLLLARIYLWFTKNRKGNSLNHLLMLDANMFEGQIRGHAFIEEDSDVASLWGEKIIIELKPFSKENGEEVKDSYLYIYSGNYVSEFWEKKSAVDVLLGTPALKGSIGGIQQLLNNRKEELEDRQDKAFLYKMSRYTRELGRGLKYTELECLTVERESKMNNLNQNYRELMNSHSYDNKLDSFLMKIIERFWRNTTYLEDEFPPIVLTNLNLSINSIHQQKISSEDRIGSDVIQPEVFLGNVILVQECKAPDLDSYYMVHGDEWGDNFLIDAREIIPIDYEDVVYVEKGKHQFFTGGGTLAQRFINEKVMPNGFKCKNYAPMNTIASLGRLIASLIQYRCRMNKEDINGTPGEALLRSLNKSVKQKLMKKTKTEQKQLLNQLNLSIIDWLAHWVNKGKGKMPEEDFFSVRDFIVKHYLTEFEQSEDELVPIPKSSLLTEYKSKLNPRKPDSASTCPICSSKNQLGSVKCETCNFTFD